MVMNSLTDMLARGMELSVICSEDYPFIDTTADHSDTLLGNIFLESLATQCDLWPRGEVAEDFHSPAVSDLPVLLLSGEEDGHLRLTPNKQPTARRSNFGGETGAICFWRRHGPLERRRRSARCPARCDALRSEYRRRGATWIAATARRPTTWVAGALLYHAENDTLVAITKVGSTRQASPHSACRTTGRRQNPLCARLAPLRRRRTCSPPTS